MEINFDLKKLQIVDIETVRPNTWNPKPKGGKEYDRLKRSIELKGQRAYPVVVRENDGLEIIDGEQRWTACTDLGFDKILVYNEGKVSDKEAKELTIWYQQQVPFDHIELSYLMTEMSNEYGELELPFDLTQLEEMKSIAEFDFDQYQSERPETSDDNVRTLSLVMAKDKYDMICATLDAVVEREEVADRSRALELICADYASGK